MTNKDKSDLNEQWRSAQDQPDPTGPPCDLQKYREYVEDFDLSEEEQTELLKTLWMIMAAFVDLGFGVDSIQLLPSSGQKPELVSSQDVDEPGGAESRKQE